MMASDLDLQFVYNGALNSKKITPEMDSAYKKPLYWHIGHHSMETD